MATPITFPAGSIVAQVDGQWNEQCEPVAYSVEVTQERPWMAVVLLAGIVSGTKVTSPSGAALGGGNVGVGFNGGLSETGTYMIVVAAAHMGPCAGSPFTLVVVLGSFG